MRYKIIVFLLIVFSVTRFQIFAQVNDIADGIRQLEDLQFSKAKSIFYSLTLKDRTDCKAMFYLGQTYFMQKQYDSAEYYYKKIPSINPESPYAFLANGNIKLRADDSENALILFKQARKIAKKDENITLLIVNACLNMPKPDMNLANTFLIEFEKMSPQNPYYFIYKAQFDFKKGEYGKAISDFEWAVYNDPNNCLAYTKLGQLYSDALLYREALTAFNKSIEIDSNQVMVYKFLGDLYYRYSKYPEAKKAYQKYLSIAEVNIDNLERYAFILFYNKEFEEALKEGAKLILQNPTNPIMNRIMAYASYETGDFENGMKYITKFFELYDNTKLLAPDYLYYGKLSLKTGNDSIGIVNITKALQLDDTKTDSYIDLAAALSKHKKHDDAIAIYEKLIKKGIDKANTYFRIGREYYFKGQNFKDVYDSSKILAKTIPDSNIISFNDSILAMGNFAKADSFFTLVTLITPDFYGGWFWKGRMLSLIDVNMEKGGLAKEAFEKALSLLEKENNIGQNVASIIVCYRYLGAYYYISSDNIAEADKNLSASLKMRSIEYWQKIIDLNPDDPQAKEVLIELTKPPKKESVKKRPN